MSPLSVEQTLLRNPARTASRHGLHAVAVAAGAMILVHAALFVTSVHRQHRAEIEARLKEEERNIVSVGRYVADHYATMDGAIQLVADFLGGRDPATLEPLALVAMKESIERPLRHHEIEVNIWLPDGTNALLRGAGPNIADRDAFALHFRPPAGPDAGARLRIEGTGSMVAAPVLGVVRKGLRILPLSRALRDADGRIVGVATATAPEENFLDLFNILRHRETDSIALMRNDRLGLIRVPYDERFSGQILDTSLLFQTYPAQPSGRFDGISATDGLHRVGVHLGLAPLPLVLAIAFETAPVDWTSLEPYRQLVGPEMLALTFALAFALAAYLATRRAVERSEYAGRARDAAVASESHLRAILSSAHDGIILLDEDQRVTGFNRAAESIFGIPESALLGRPLDAVLPKDARTRHASLMQGMSRSPDVARAMSNWRSVRGLHASGREFPAMVSISKTTAAGSTMYLAVVRDMSEFQAAETELKRVAADQARLRDLAEQANSAKSKFLATMSHELRTPLNAIIGFSESIDMGIAGPAGSAKYKEYIQLILSSGRHLLSLINDILDLSRIQAGAVLKDIHPVDLRVALAEAAQILHSRIQAKRIDLREEIADEVEFRTDARALLQVLLNVIGNAIKFSPEGGRITLRLARGPDGGGAIEVLDEGPGIGPTTMARIGEPFTQERNPLVSSNEGAGLGLAITIDLLKLMGGRLTLRNRDPRGLEARIDLDPPHGAARLTPAE